MSITRDKPYEEVWAQESGGNWPAWPKRHEEGAGPKCREGRRARPFDVAQDPGGERGSP
jgi:hypothetical protein